MYDKALLSSRAWPSHRVLTDQAAVDMNAYASSAVISCCQTHRKCRIKLGIEIYIVIRCGSQKYVEYLCSHNRTRRLVSSYLSTALPFFSTLIKGNALKDCISGAKLQRRLDNLAPEQTRNHRLRRRSVDGPLRFPALNLSCHEIVEKTQPSREQVGCRS
ncbi:hypothetical protein BC826DRAFT_575892 [Russula brevipes]|nr:hypothetical protein BC826DRAFT_575892 [Russula brevipes]